MFSAAATHWATEVGKRVEVKGVWWVGGSAAERSKWHTVTVIEHTTQHEFEVKRKGQPTSTRVGKALKIRVDAVQDGSEDAWMDVNLVAVRRVKDAGGCAELHTGAGCRCGEGWAVKKELATGQSRGPSRQYKRVDRLPPYTTAASSRREHSQMGCVVTMAEAEREKKRYSKR